MLGGVIPGIELTEIKVLPSGTSQSGRDKQVKRHNAECEDSDGGF